MDKYDEMAEALWAQEHSVGELAGVLRRLAAEERAAAVTEVTAAAAKALTEVGASERCLLAVMEAIDRRRTPAAGEGPK